MKPLSTSQKILAAILFAIIVFFAFFRLIGSPPYAFDEGWATQVGMNIAQHGADGLQFAPGSFTHVSVLTSVGYPLIYALALWLKIFGAGVAQARAMMAVYMLVLSATSFILLRRIFGNMFALASLALLATLPPFYVFGKQVIGEVPVLTFITLFLLCFNLAVASARRRRFWFVLAGLAAGLCLVTKTSALVFGPVLVVAAIIAYRRGIVTWKDILTVAVSAIPPFVAWILVNFQQGDTLASVLDYYTNPAAVTDHVANFYHNMRLLFTSPGPFFAIALLAVWIAGVAVRLAKHVKLAIEEWIALLFSLAILAAFTRLYGDARYLFPIQALAIFFAPYSAYRILQAIRFRSEHARAWAFGSAVALLSVAGAYQLVFHSYIADSYSSTATADLQSYFSQLPATTTVFFYNATNAIPFFRGDEYYQHIAMFEKWQLGSDLGAAVRSGKIDVFVLNQLSKADQKVDMHRYAQTARFNDLFVYTRASN